MKQICSSKVIFCYTIIANVATTLIHTYKNWYITNVKYVKSIHYRHCNQWRSQTAISRRVSNKIFKYVINRLDGWLHNWIHNPPKVIFNLIIEGSQNVWVTCIKNSSRLAFYEYFLITLRSTYTTSKESTVKTDSDCSIVLPLQ